MKGEGIVYPKAGKSFDPVLIPKAIHDAGLTATEVEVMVDGTLATKNGVLELDVPGLKHPFILAGGTQERALEEHKDMVGKRVREAGKIRLGHVGLPPAVTVETFQSIAN